jgi:adenosylcobyric acid synthase
MVCGTASDAGKSILVAGLCRLLARRGVRVAPFKGQNMALNSWVTSKGHEIGRAQAMQATAARVEAEVAMNPVLLKPTGDRTSQVVVMGRPWRILDASSYQAAKAELTAVVDRALHDLRRRFDVVVCEGAGSPAEINLLDHDLVNLGLAARHGLPALVVGDIDRGGVFAHLMGTMVLLPEGLRGQVNGFVLNKFRGDPTLLGVAIDELTRRTGVPMLGVLPWLGELGIDAEDSLALRPQGPLAGEGRCAADTAPGVGPAPAHLQDVLDVAVIRLPHLANFTDLDPLRADPAVRVRYVDHRSLLGQPDLVVLPGSKATAADLQWLRSAGLADALTACRRAEGGPMILGICAGYQMAGRRISDPGHVESSVGVVDGLGWLDLETRFAPGKITRQRVGYEAGSGTPVAGYEIHAGVPVAGPEAEPWFTLCGPEAGQEREGVVSADGVVLGTSLHGLLESDAFRDRLLERAARRSGKRWSPSGVRFGELRERQLDRVADACATHLDVDAIVALLARAAPARTAVMASRPS